MNPGQPPLVSICIPTHNRAGFLSRLLQSVECQKDSLPYELRVQDNASVDDTAAVFARMACSDPRWFYERNERDLGGRANIRLCTTQARGRYVWIVGDDDHLLNNALGKLAGVLLAADRDGASAILCSTKLGSKYKEGALFPSGLEWLRRLSVNVPAFISGTIWERDFWNGYPYGQYPAEMSLPQLDCFIEACLSRKVLGYSGQLVAAGQAERTDEPSFWFYAQHARVDCFEYPALYAKILKRGRTDLLTNIVIRLRRVALLREIWKKALFIRYNEAHYRVSRESFRPYHGGTCYWPFMRALLWLVLDSRIGQIVAARTYKGVDRLPTSLHDGHGG